MSIGASLAAYILLCAFLWWLDSASEIQWKSLLASLVFWGIGLVLSIIAAAPGVPRPRLARLAMACSLAYLVLLVVSVLLLVRSVRSHD